MMVEKKLGLAGRFYSLTPKTHEFLKALDEKYYACRLQECPANSKDDCAELHAREQCIQSSDTKVIE